MRTLLLSFICLYLSGCTVYVEKRSEALSRAVMATSDSIDASRIDLAQKYSKEAVKLAYPPKNKIKISPIKTKVVKKVVPVAVTKEPTPIRPSLVPSVVVPKPVVVEEKEEQETRLVLPENMNYVPLVENSPEWKELLLTKEFNKQLTLDYEKLEKMKKDTESELQKQNEMREKMVKDLNIMQKKIVEKNLTILRLQVTVVSLIVVMAGAVYLRIKGIL